MQNRGQSIVVSIYMDNQFHPDSPSRNIIIDFVGVSKPDEYVLIGGHGDSWDIAEGAMDDGTPV
jgi:carboxypeptidase Q